jgi:5-(carboxyamino)imidazole ribonucleotide synthase
MNQTGTIGIVGGGQLGRMLTEAALPLGYKVIVIDPTDNCPAAQVGAEQIKANFYDEKAIRDLAEKADYITIESEHVNTLVLAQLAAEGKQVNPSPKIVGIIQDKFIQKQFLKEVGIPVADFVEITDEAAAMPW